MFHLFTKQTKKGFTLIELLVVVSIIGLLASIVVVSLGGARKGGRDTRRQADIRQLQNAMELCNSELACGGSATIYDYPGTTAAKVSTCAALTTALAKYIAAEPKDPDGSTYKCFSDGASYCISPTTALESTGKWVRASDEGYNTEAGAACAAETDK